MADNSKIYKTQNVIVTTSTALFVLTLFASFLTGRTGFLNIGMALFSAGILLAFLCFSVDLVINEWREKHYLFMSALIAIYGGILFAFSVGPWMLLEALHRTKPSPASGYPDPYSQWFKTGMILTGLGMSLWVVAAVHVIATNASGRRPLWKSTILGAIAIMGAACLVLSAYHLVLNIQKMCQ